MDEEEEGGEEEKCARKISLSQPQFSYCCLLKLQLCLRIIIKTKYYVKLKQNCHIYVWYAKLYVDMCLNMTFHGNYYREYADCKVSTNFTNRKQKRLNYSHSHSHRLCTVCTDTVQVCQLPSTDFVVALCRDPFDKIINKMRTWKKNSLPKTKNHTNGEQLITFHIFLLADFVSE